MLRHVYFSPGSTAAAGLRAGDLLHVHGLQAEASSALSGLDAVRAQADATLTQMQALLRREGGSIAELACVTAYVRDAATEREAVYDVWDVLFPRADDKPAFKILDAHLPDGVAFRLDFIALLGAARRRIDIPGVDARDPTVRIGNLVITSRLHGTLPATGEIVEGLEAQARQALANGIELVERAGGSRRAVTQVCGFGRDLTYVETLRRVIDEAFPGSSRPDLHCIQTFVRPVLEVMVELTAWLPDAAT